MNANGPPLEDLYFEWLYAIIGSTSARNPSRTIWKLARQLHNKEFVWLIPNDDNRIADAKLLREYFLEDNHISYVDPYWLELGCSMLEMLIALANRLSFEDEDEKSSREWFWILLQNLHIAQFSDKIYNVRIGKIVDNILETVIWRTYAPNGEGGLFPMQYTKNDQRKVEIWYQLSEYLLSTKI